MNEMIEKIIEEIAEKGLNGIYTRIQKELSETD